MRDQRLRHALAFAAIVALGMVLAWTHTLEPLDRLLGDAGFRWLREQRPQPLQKDVVLVGIDEKTFQALREPFALWHPHLGRFFKGMALARPSVLGLDIVLPDRSYDFMLPRYDQPLAEGLLALRGAVPIVLAQSLDEHGNLRLLFPPYLSIVGKEGLGSVVVCLDPDQKVRRFDEQACGAPDGRDGGEVTLAGRMAKHLGLDQLWSGWIDYAVGDAVSYVPFHEVLGWMERGETARLEQTFRGKPVVLGVVLPFTDRHSLPVPLAAFEPEATLVPGVLIHVQAVRSMLHHGLVQAPPVVLQYAFFLLALGLFMLRTGPLKIALLVATIALALAGSVMLLWKGVRIPGATIAALASLAFAARAAFDAWERVRERRFLSGAFSSYVSPPILKEILAGRIKPGTAGTRCNVCVMFCDIRGFTTRSEGLSPERVITLLNTYFTAITAAVYKHGGTTNKFIGDGMLAFFGAPQSLPNCSKSALEAAQDMLVNLQAVNARLVAAGDAPLEMGIGLHMGEVVLGHVGGALHQEYTAIGDVVNVASRIEGMTKEVGYPIVCSAPVAEAVGKSGGLVSLGELPVRGHSAVGLYGWQPPLLASPPFSTKSA